MFRRTLSYTFSLILVNIFIHSISLAQGTRTEYEIRLLKESDRTKYIVLSAPADLNEVVDFKLPPANGTVGQVLAINSAGKMEWTTPSTSSAPTVSPFPVGTIIQYAGDNAPSGWLMCDGSLIPESPEYDSLKAVIDKKYGSGSEYRLPNMQGKFALGKDAVRGIGVSGGEETVVLDSMQMPRHRHTFMMSSEGTTSGLFNSQVPLSNPPIYRIYLNVAPGSVPTLFKQAPTTELNKKFLGIETISNEGGGLAHNNMPPYIVVNFIIKY